ncbi:hypothetical protein DB30_00573 [Enhygromyxa salina]|uniref:DUF4139 domain-containing protein n=1 Tax=Enhygromyxa salina TaxID=215803 RepID=A0A0C1ZQ37_9BACT|nr:hypothetical protein [Enhygromyxa salina]KIG13108.1 hypothetical protein DB30_00573 [Enhygromyxa salina]
MRRLASLSIILAVSGCATLSQERPLPLTKLRLYETGVGYYERAGQLGGPSGASLPVPSGHLDDALKSLVVLGEDGSVRSIAFDSRQSPAVARARAGLPPESDAPIRVHDVLLGLRGHELVLTSGRKRVRGRLVDVIGVPDADRLGVEPTEDNPGPTTAEQAGATPDKTFALVVTATGRYRRVDVATIHEITPVDPGVRSRMQAALDATVALHSNARGQLEVEGEGASVRLGYLAESPVWRASYRLVLDPSKPSALQGWALVHNDTEEDWDDITLELVNGRPDSFLFPLAAPRYERRDLVVPDRELSSVPQLLDTTPDAMWGDFLDTDLVTYGSGGTSTGYGYGSGHGSLGSRSSGRGARIELGNSELVAVGNLAELAVGQGRETKTAFVYGAGEPLDLAAGRSAMVPFLQSSLESAAVTWFGGFSSGPARHAVQVLNSTSQTLPEGTLSVFGDGGFAGETVLPRLKPGERRFLEIGDDPDTELTIVDRESDDLPKQLVYLEGGNGDLQEHFLRTTTITLDLANRSGQARHVHVLVAAGSNTTIEGADKVDFDVDRGQPVAIFELAPNGRIDARKLVIKEGLSRTNAVTSLSLPRIERLSTARSLTEAERTAITATQAKLIELRAAEAEVTRLDAEIATITADIERLRGHLQAMSGDSAGEKGPLVTRLLSTEDQLQIRRRELAAAKVTVDSRIEATRATLVALAL